MTPFKYRNEKKQNKQTKQEKWMQPLEARSRGADGKPRLNDVQETENTGLAGAPRDPRTWSNNRAGDTGVQEAAQGT